MPQSVVYVTVKKPSAWQRQTEAAYGPFTSAEVEQFGTWIRSHVQVSRLAVLPLESAPPGIFRDVVHMHRSLGDGKWCCDL